MVRFVTSRVEQNRPMALKFNTDETEITAEELHKERVLCSAVMETLQRFYPGHVWMVKVGGNDKARGVEIKIPILMGTKSFVLPVWMLMQDFATSQRLVQRAGGEILERFRIPTTRFQADPFMIAKHARGRITHKTPMPE